MGLFGATSSPGCCAFGLNYIADQFRLIHGDAASEFIHRNVYVDDGLKSVPSPSDAIDLIQGTRKLCHEFKVDCISTSLSLMRMS